MSDELDGDEHFERTEDYVYHIPAPPRIVVPPPPASDRASGVFNLGLSTIFPRAVAEAQLRQYDSTALINWTYEKRQRAQHVLPYLLLGPMTVTRDAEWLRNENITLALAVKQGQGRILDAALNRCRSVGIESQSVSIEQTYNLVSLYPATTLLLATHLTQNVQRSGSPGKALVFCESGNERSAAVTAAFIMATYEDVDHIKAMQLCQLKRFCSNFSEPIKHSLQTYWDILCAQRSSTAANVQVVMNTGDTQMTLKSSSRKRRAQDEDVDMMDEDDEWSDANPARSRSRAAAPFVDELNGFR